MNKARDKILHITYAAIIAALYVALTWLSNAFGLASLAVQIRLGEALCVLSFFTPAAPAGLFVGCIISNLTMGSAAIDIIFGSLATLVGAYFGMKMKSKWFVPFPTVLANTITVPFVILICYTNEPWSLGIYAVTAFGVFIGELASAYIIGMILLLALERRNIFKRKK